MEMENGLISSEDTNHVMTFKKLEELVQLMQGATDGITMETNLNIGNAFTGSSIISWLASRVTDKDVLEANQILRQLEKFNYVYSVEEAAIKREGPGPVFNIKVGLPGPVLALQDERLYRFQAPYYWPSIHTNPDDVDYAIYLVKKKKSRKDFLSEHEMLVLQKLKELNCDSWDFIESQSEEQLRLMREYSEVDRLMIMGQEKIFWKMRRPQNNLLKRMLNCQRLKISKVIQSMVKRSEIYAGHDPFISQTEPSNPWKTDDATLWASKDDSGTDVICESRLRKWGISMRDLLSDMRGMTELKSFLESEFSSENIEFLLAVGNMKKMPMSRVDEAAGDIFKKFLHEGSEMEINIDSKTMSITMEREKQPNRYMFEEAEEHIFMLLESDSYPRYLRSDQYKNLLVSAQSKSTQKNKKFSFGFKKRIKDQQVTSSESGQKRDKLVASATREKSDSRASSISSTSSTAIATATGNSSCSGNLSDNCSSQNSDHLEWHSGRNQISYSTGDLKMAVDGRSHVTGNNNSMIGGFSPRRLKNKLRKLARSVSPLPQKFNLDVPRNPHHYKFKKDGRTIDRGQTVSSGENSATDLRKVTDNIRTVVSVPGNLCNVVEPK